MNWRIGGEEREKQRVFMKRGLNKISEAVAFWEMQCHVFLGPDWKLGNGVCCVDFHSSFYKSASREPPAQCKSNTNRSQFLINDSWIDLLSLVIQRSGSILPVICLCLFFVFFYLSFYPDRPHRCPTSQWARCWVTGPFSGPWRPAHLSK